MKRWIVTLLAVLFVVSAASAQEVSPVPAPPAEFHQMDWFIGEWSVVSRYRTSIDPEVWDETTLVSTIRPILDGYALLETFTGPLLSTAYDAISIRTYNPALGKWEQRYLDNSGTGYAEYTGEWNEEAGEFVAYGNRSFKPQSEGGRGELSGAREVFFDIEDDRFSWRWETSSDGGETWSVVWTLEYTRTM